MSPVTHFLTGWALANVARLGRRDRALVTCAVVIPDIDGLGFIPEWLTLGSPHPILWFSQYHHALHTLLFATVVTFFGAAFAQRHAMASALMFAGFHVHLLEDVAGSRGPDGYAWPIPYLQPFSNAWTWTWPGQWGLNSWPNVALTCALLGVLFYIAVKYGRSPLEFVSQAADAAFVGALRARFVRGSA